MRLKRIEFGKELLFHILSENGPNLGRLSFDCRVDVQLTQEEIKTFMELISKLKILTATCNFLCDSLPSTIPLTNLELQTLILRPQVNKELFIAILARCSNMKNLAVRQPDVDVLQIIFKTMVIRTIYYWREKFYCRLLILYDTVFVLFLA